MPTALALSCFDDDVAAQITTALAQADETPEVLLLQTREDVDGLFDVLSRPQARVIHVLSPELLQDAEVLSCLLEGIRDKARGANYGDRVLPILLSTALAEAEPNWNPKEITNYWIREVDRISLELVRSGKKGPEQNPAILQISTAKFIAEHVGAYHDLITNHHHLYRSLDEFVAESPDVLATLVRPLTAAESPEATVLTERRQALERLEALIHVPPPGLPEFPPGNPRFPATPTVAINVGHREILLKDEGQNPTGSHKDRLAWEIIVFYKQMITTRLLSDEIEQDLPSLSMISSGSAAVAVQTMLQHYRLPPLRVIVDSSMRPSVVEHLKRLGCLVYPVSLSDKQLSDEDVKALTDNHDGLDITSRTTADSALTKYYDWLTYEILNQHPRWIFVPVGTGDLYGNIARIIFDSLTVEDDISDGRLKASKNDLLRIGLVGATTDRNDSILDKLYAPFGPELQRVRKYLEDRRAFFAPESGIFEVSDDSVREAQGYASANSITVTEPSGIAGLGLYLEKYEDVIDDRDSILVVNTGRLYVPSDAEEPDAGVAPVGMGLGGIANRRWGRIRGRAAL